MVLDFSKIDEENKKIILGEYEFDEKSIGKEYLTQLVNIALIRADRKKIYGNSFLNESIKSLLSIIDGKRARFNFLLQNNPTHSKAVDDILDVCNYYLFIACLLEKNKKDGEKNGDSKI